MSKTTGPSPKLVTHSNESVTRSVNLDRALRGISPKPSARASRNRLSANAKRVLLEKLVSRTTIRVDVARCLFGIAAIIAALNAAGLFDLVLSKFR